jgi:hypothetical protein
MQPSYGRDAHVLPRRRAARWHCRTPPRFSPGKIASACIAHQQTRALARRARAETSSRGARGGLDIGQGRGKESGTRFSRSRANSSPSSACCHAAGYIPPSFSLPPHLSLPCSLHSPYATSLSYSLSYLPAIERPPPTPPVPFSLPSPSPPSTSVPPSLTRSSISSRSHIPQSHTPVTLCPCTSHFPPPPPAMYTPPPSLSVHSRLVVPPPTHPLSCSLPSMAGRWTRQCVLSAEAPRIARLAP